MLSLLNVSIKYSRWDFSLICIPGGNCFKELVVTGVHRTKFEQDEICCEKESTKVECKPDKDYVFGLTMNNKNKMAKNACTDF